jgi:hypothetical protein
MPKHGDRRPIIAKSPSQVRSECIRTATELAIRQRSSAADVRDGIRGRQGPMIDSFDEIHSKPLINKWRRGKVATTVHHDQARNYSEII